jgi:hypothetical protein
MKKYSCSKCGLAVIVENVPEPIFACECNATVIAEMSAVAEGQGGVKN